MQAKNIQEFFGTLQQSTVEAWKKHLKVSKKSEHETLNDFYEDIVDVVDSLIEDYMSIHGKVEDYVNLLSEKEMTALEYLETLREFTRESADELLDEDDTELFSDVDNILSVMDTAIYKLKELEGGKDDKKTNESFSLMSYLSESLGKSIVNEGIEIVGDERDYVCIHDKNITKKDFLVIDIPMGYVQLMDKGTLELSAEDDMDLDDEDLNAILKLKYGEIYKMQDTFFVKI
jgi:hypothetical protein